jgi:hypothetical protein
MAAMVVAIATADDDLMMTISLVLLETRPTIFRQG